MVPTYFGNYLLEVALSLSSPFGRTCDRASHVDTPIVGQRRRDIFPLPTISDILAYYTPTDDGPDAELFRRYLNASVDALNFWFGFIPATIPAFTPTATQKDCLHHWIARAERLLFLLAKVPEHVWKRSEPARLATLTASRVDVLEQCGCIYTLSLLTPSVTNIATSGKAMFPSVTAQDAKIQRFRGNISEYATLLARQLRAKRLRLRRSIIARGSCFYVTKPGKDMLRHLWNGNKLSS